MTCKCIFNFLERLGWALEQTCCGTVETNAIYSSVRFRESEVTSSYKSCAYPQKQFETIANQSKINAFRGEEHRFQLLIDEQNRNNVVCQKLGLGLNHSELTDFPLIGYCFKAASCCNIYLPVSRLSDAGNFKYVL